MALRFSDYDSRRYHTVDVREGYRRWSERYDEMMSGDIDIRLLASLTSVDWAVPFAVDLACGTGRIGGFLSDSGAEHIDGVDLCEEMLARARARGVYASLELADVRHTSLPSARARLVVSVLAIEHLPELEPFYAEARRLLAKDGTLIVVGYHPHFLLNGIPTHFRDADGQDVAIENHVHLFSDHVRAARSLGFELLESAEPVVDASWVARLPSWSRHLGRPASFALVWRLAER